MIDMNLRIALRVASLLMFIIAAVFVVYAAMCPTCGRVFYIRGVEITIEMWQIYYKSYAIITVTLFLISFFVKKEMNVNNKLRIGSLIIFVILVLYMGRILLDPSFTYGAEIEKIITEVIIFIAMAATFIASFFIKKNK